MHSSFIPNTVIESQWTLLDSQFLPDFPDYQIRECDSMKEWVKRDWKKPKIFRSLYLMKFGLISKGEGSSDNEEKQKYAFDSCTFSQELPMN